MKRTLNISISFVKWYSNNTSVVYILKKGSLKKDLNLLAMAIFRECLEHNVVLELEQVPRINANIKFAYFLTKEIANPDD